MDWQQVLKDIEAAGLTQTEVATRCGVAQSTVSDLSRGKSKQPSFGFGAALIALRDECAKPVAAPTEQAAA